MSTARRRYRRIDGPRATRSRLLFCPRRTTPEKRAGTAARGAVDLRRATAGGCAAGCASGNTVLTMGLGAEG